MYLSLDFVSEKPTKAGGFFHRAIACKVGMDLNHRYRYRNVLNIEPDSEPDTDTDSDLEVRPL